MDDRDEPAVVRFAEYEGIETRDRLRAALQAVAQHRRLIVDLTGTVSMDSLVLAELYRAYEARRTSGRSLVVVARNQRIVRLLSIAGLTGRVPIVDTLEAARAYESP